MPEIYKRALKHFRAIAAVDATGSHTYTELTEDAAELAVGLLKGRTDLQGARIAFLVPGSAAYVKLQWAIWLAGGVAVPVSLHHPLPSIEYLLRDTAAECLVVSQGAGAVAQEDLAKCCADLDVGLIVLEELADGLTKELEKELTNGPSRLLPVIEPHRPAMILYTSGTTSLPKGVVITHANLQSQIETLVAAWEWSSTDRIACVLPLHHVHGIVNVLSCALWSGATVYFEPKFDPAKLFALFQAESVNLFMAVPTIYFKLIAHYDQLEVDEQQRVSNCLRTFRLMVSGSAALPVAVLEKWRAISGQTLLERYGMTEIGMAISNPYRSERRAGYIGQPLPAVQVRLVSDAGELIPADREEAGEIEVRGPSVFKNYWQNEEATTKAFTSDGWFKTGDVAIVEKGSYRILGRSSIDIIKSGGYKISALEIEEVLRTHPEVVDCGVIGLPDEEWGEIVVVALVVKDGKIDTEPFKTWMKTQLPAYRIPRKIIQLVDLPRNALGKLTKNELRKLF